MIDDTSYTGGYYSGGTIAVGGGSVATAPGWPEPVLATVSHETCWGLERRTQLYPPAEQGAGHGDDLYGRRKARLTQHVHSVGDNFEVGQVTVEIVERIGTYYTVRVVDPSTPDPAAASGKAFAGRFSDDDGSVHEGNIEVIAELGITRGCGDPEDNTFCPKRLVTRSHIVTFLARALGEEEGEGSTTSRFSDVLDDAWYLASLERLADLGVVEPFEDGTFRPRDRSPGWTWQSS